MKRELIENLAKSPPYFSIFIDGSTDASVVEQELLYVLHLSDGVPTLKFLEIKSVEHAHAEGITESITESLADFSLQDIAMVAFCADGASVNMGNRNGVAARLRREQPCLITIHCLNHRLELAAKDAFKNTKEEEVIEMLNSLYYLYQKSPKRWRELQKVAEVMEDSVLKPQKANGTRWVQHKARACKAVIVSYSALIGHLENQSEDGNVPPVDRAKVKGYLKKLKSVSFVLHLLLLKEILSPLSILSESLQKNVTYFHLAMSNVAHFYERIGSLGVEDIDAEPMPKRPAFEEINLSAFLKAVEVHREEPVTFKGVELTRGAVSVEAFKRQMSTLVENVQQAVRTRFGDVHDDPRFQMMKLLDTSSWPKSKEDLNKFGTEEVITFKEHFGSLIKSQGADPEELLEEWGNLKFFWHRSLSHLNVDDTWAAVILRYSDVYPNLVHMVYVMLLVPVSNAAVERGFSAMGRIKTDHRNRLNSSTLDSLMRITLDGPDPSEYDSTHAAELFFSKTSGRRGRTSS